MTPLRRHAEDYLATRRALGYKLEGFGEQLTSFVAHLERMGAATVTAEAALAWADDRPGRRPEHVAVRLRVARQFASWLRAVDPTCEVPPPDMATTARYSRRAPFLLRDADIVALMAAARAIANPLKAATYETLIGLLAATGMRIGEAIGLDDRDVDWHDGVLTVRGAKFNKDRQVPLHATTVKALKRYVATRDRLCPASNAAAVLVSTTGTRLIYKDVHREWHHLVTVAGVGAGGRGHPRVHDTRHSFAVTTLTGWYRDGADVAVMMPVLSTYMGHVKPSSTYWYLEAAPELLALAAERLERAGQR